MYARLGVTCHLHFWQNVRSLLRATLVTRGWDGRQTRGSTQGLLLRRKFSRRSYRNSNSQPFDHESGALTNKLSRLQIRFLIHKPLRIGVQPKHNHFNKMLLFCYFKSQSLHERCHIDSIHSSFRSLEPPKMLLDTQPPILTNVKLTRICK